MGYVVYSTLRAQHGARYAGQEFQPFYSASLHRVRFIVEESGRYVMPIGLQLKVYYDTYHK